MTEEELREYINKIEPNFNSHLEKGTIEMSIEYYNLLEEKMVRLINKNKHLKEVIDKAIEYIKYCQTSDDDIFPVIEAEKMIELLKGEENE